MGGTALVTGASSGIGRELAALFARDGFDLILVARRADALEALAAELRARAGVRVRVLPADLSSPGAAEALAAAATAEADAVEVLVNAAGFGLRGDHAELPLDAQLRMIRLNVEALTELTRRLLPSMLRRGGGGVLNVASTAGFQPGPRMAVYYATKAYVLSFTEAIAEECRGSGLRITCLAPGPTASEFQEVAGLGTAPLLRIGMMSSRRVAEIGYDAWRRGRVLVVPGMRNRLLAWSVRFTPRWLARRVVRGLHGRLGPQEGRARR